VALNDFIRINRTPVGLDIIVGSSKLQIRSGYIILPQQAQAAEATTEIGAKWNRSDDGTNQQRDSGGVRGD